MAIANVEISTSTFLDWVTKTNQILVIANRLTEGQANTTGTFKLTNAGGVGGNITLNVASGMIKGDGGLLTNVSTSSLTTNTISVVSNTTHISVSGGASAELGDTIYLDSGGWDVRTTTYTANVGDSILANTSAGTWTLTLPASPATGDEVNVGDPFDWTVNNLTIGRNGETIAGLAEDLTCDVVGPIVTLVYDGTTWEPFAAW